MAPSAGRWYHPDRLRRPDRRAPAPHSSRGPGHRPLKAEITGSNPVCGTSLAFIGPIRIRIGPIVFPGRIGPRTIEATASSGAWRVIDFPKCPSTVISTGAEASRDAWAVRAATASSTVAGVSGSVVDHRQGPHTCTSRRGMARSSPLRPAGRRSGRLLSPEQGRGRPRRPRATPAGDPKPDCESRNPWEGGLSGEVHGSAGTLRSRFASLGAAPRLRDDGSP